MPKGICHHYTPDQVSFLLENRELPRRALTDLFNEKFGTHQSLSAIKSYCKRHGWLTGRSGQFVNGVSSWNSGTKGLCRPNSGSFKPGRKPSNLKPIGHQRICSKDGYVLVKTGEINPYTGVTGRYRPMQHVVWEGSNGPIPMGHVIRFIDGNKLNFELTNLVCVSMAVNQRMNKNQVNSLPDELRITGMAIAQLEVKVFEKCNAGSPSANEARRKGDRDD